MFSFYRSFISDCMVSNFSYSHLYLFTGSHTGLNIADEFQQIISAYNLDKKFNFVVTDNARNMQTAFTIAFDEADKVYLDDGSVWEEFPEIDIEVDAILRCTLTEQLSCFAHTLQLAIGDGLKVR